ncbi:MAG: serine/threonine-protein kinase [Ktedonobacteraceae bacterium]
MADRTGQELGNYRLIRLLGRGGFAEVYLGEHMRLKTQAAIKVLYAQLDHDNSEEFLQEAQTVAHLVHPNIVRIFDFDVKEGVPFLVMDYAPSGTLRQRHPKNTRLPLETIIPYIKQVADALQYAHDEKFIHRDIKPENMLVGRRGEILLSDFGIALIAQSTHMQSTQAVMGTAYYMAPEQLQGKPRRASDQYALGVVVYEWLSGTCPFAGSFREIASQHMFVPPTPLHENLPGLSSAIEEVVKLNPKHLRLHSFGHLTKAFRDVRL